ncbi:MAG: septum formation initiator family protein [Patescibacteria group bacterium]|nr:septum formation initiator family protein [Patescibacteria group bacterium]
MIKKRNKSLIGKIFSFKMFILISIFCIVFLGTGLAKEYYRDYQIQKEINFLQKEIDSFEVNNYKLSQLVEYYKTDEYKEAEARKRLNVMKEGEKVVIIKPNSENLNSLFVEEANGNENIPNYIRWWNYFFARK